MTCFNSIVKFHQGDYSWQSAQGDAETVTNVANHISYLLFLSWKANALVHFLKKRTQLEIFHQAYFVLDWFMFYHVNPLISSFSNHRHCGMVYKDLIGLKSILTQEI